MSPKAVASIRAEGADGSDRPGQGRRDACFRERHEQQTGLSHGSAERKTRSAGNAAARIRFRAAVSEHEIHHRDLLREPDRNKFLRHYQLLSDLGFAPEILDSTGDGLVTRKYPTLEAWLWSHPSETEMKTMRRRLLTFLKKVHREVGICHRDTHIRNFVLEEDRPLLIDPTLAIESDRDRPCYDLVGPAPSGVAIPAVHAAQPNNNCLGVWWDAPEPFEQTLGSVFGRLPRASRR